MVEIQGQPVPSQLRASGVPRRIQFDIPEGLRTKAAGVDKGPSDGIRAGVRRIADTAEGVQLAACRLCEALEALGRIGESLEFALEAAREALQARTLPGSALEGLQNQVDLALTGIDWKAESASFAGGDLFTGGAGIECRGERLELPALSCASLGGNWVGSMAALRVETGEIEYSQSVASVLAGGPNSLEQWANGAVMALSAGLEHVKSISGGLQEFYESRIMPAAGELAVALANVLASAPGPQNLEQAWALLDGIGGEMDEGSTGAAADGRGLLELLG